MKVVKVLENILGIFLLILLVYMVVCLSVSMRLESVLENAAEGTYENISAFPELQEAFVAAEKPLSDFLVLEPVLSEVNEDVNPPELYSIDSYGLNLSDTVLELDENYVVPLQELPLTTASLQTLCKGAKVKVKHFPFSLSIELTGFYPTQFSRWGTFSSGGTLEIGTHWFGSKFYLK